MPASAGAPHRLKHTFCFWYLNKKSTKGSAAAASESGGGGHSYEDSIKKLASFSTVEEFWSVYSHLHRPNDLPSSINYHLFREGIAPMWEDPTNAAGGKWMLRLKKGMSSRVWEDVLLAVVGDAFHVGDEICGVVLVTKNGEDVLSVWNKHAHAKDLTTRIRDTLKRILDLPSTAPLEYRPHDLAMKNAQGVR